MREIRGNIFDQDVDVVCIAANGSVMDNGKAVMGCGRALDAELLFPGLADLLGVWINAVGNHLHYLKFIEERGYTICSFPIRDKWDGEVDLKLVEESCKDLVESTMPNITVALPPMGCGADGKTWEDIKKIMAKHFDDRFVIVEPENV